MYHPTTRLLTLLEILQCHGQLSGAELAPVDLQALGRAVRRGGPPAGQYHDRPLRRALIVG
jgi:hypothetical protein